MKIVRLIGIVVASLIALLLVVVFVARFGDGPMGFFPGGALVAGESMEETPSDWSFVRDVDTIEFELEHPLRSRTTWIVAHDGHAYIPCGVPNFRLWKQWPHDAMEDGRGRVRIDHEIYDVQLVRVSDTEEWEAVRAQVNEKYGQGATLDADALWIFRLDPRS